MAEQVFPGADESTPSRAQYFSWINNTNEGPTESQTLANLAFFRYLHEQFGMVLDIYAFDAGAIDGAKFYGSTKSERFKRQFPRGFAPAVAAAKAMGTRLGVWGGPDGFGDTPQEAQERIDMMVGLCRDHDFALFKFDSVCGPLREDKIPHFVDMMTQCRKHAPDLILLNHRLQLGAGMPHATTALLEGAETYIDVHMANTVCATHNRAGALARELPPRLKRLLEDHGVCVSSCLDFWDDDLILQAFNRNLILAPEIYGNPWLLRDDELPRLARIYNLHRRYRQILSAGMVLPKAKFGPGAVSRGDDRTRLVTLRNLTWKPVRYRVPLDKTIGLLQGGKVEVRRLHPHEAVLAAAKSGETVEVEVLPFRACLLLVESRPATDVRIAGCDYDVICDVAGKPVVVDLLAPPGQTARVQLLSGSNRFSAATLDGQDTPALARGKAVDVTFPGTPLQAPWHRKIADLKPAAVPDDARALYEATAFAADNNALEARELQRSGPTAIEAVQNARDAFFNQPLFRQRYLWDRYAFDDDPETALAVCRRWPHVGDLRIRRGSLRIDFGSPVAIDHLLIESGNEQFLAPFKSQEGARAAVSADLKTWRDVAGFVDGNITFPIPGDQPWRYFRLEGAPELVRHVRGSYRGRMLDRSAWRASNLFAAYHMAPATHAFTARFTLPDAPPGGYLALAIHGEHGNELAYAALRTPTGYVGAPRRAPSFPCNPWECPVRPVSANYTYFFPITPDLVGQELDAVALILKDGNPAVRCDLHATAYPIPHARQRLVLRR